MLFCSTHNLNNLCSECFDECHEDCKIITMAKKDKITKSAIDSLQKREDEKKLLLEKIDKRKQEIIENIELELNTIKEEIQNDYSKTVDGALKFINFELFSKNSKQCEFNEILENKLNVSFNDTKIDHGISIIHEQSDANRSSDIEESNRDISEVEVNYIDLSNSMNKLNLKYSTYATDTMAKSYKKYSWISLEFLNQDDKCFSFFDIDRNEFISNLSNLLIKYPYVKKVQLNRIPFSKNWMAFFVGLKKSINFIESISIISAERCHFNYLIDFVVNCSNLQVFEIINTDSNIVESLYQDLSINETLEDVKKFCTLLSCCSENIRIIVFENIYLTPKTCRFLGNALKNCQNIKKLSVSRNPQMKDGYKAICDGLEISSSQLMEIDFSFCGLNSNQLKMIADFVSKCSKIEFIYLEQNLEDK